MKVKITYEYSPGRNPGRKHLAWGRTFSGNPIALGIGSSWEEAKQDLLEILEIETKKPKPEKAELPKIEIPKPEKLTLGTN